MLDVVENGGVRIAILDAQRRLPHARRAGNALPAPHPGGQYRARGEAICFRLAGPTCLAGDVIGDYDFDRPLQEGDLVLFGDMAIYTTCKNNTFNGMPLPNLWKLDSAGGLEQLTAHGYNAFKSRLGR